MICFRQKAYCFTPIESSRWKYQTKRKDKVISDGMQRQICSPKKYSTIASSCLSYICFVDDNLKLQFTSQASFLECVLVFFLTVLVNSFCSLQTRNAISQPHCRCRVTPSIGLLLCSFPCHHFTLLSLQNLCYS